MMERIEERSGPFLLAMGLGVLLAFLVAFQPGFRIGLAVLVAGVIGLAFFNRRAALYLIVPAIALTPEIPFLGVPLRLEDLLMVPLAAGWLAHQCVFKDRQRTPLDRLLFAYVIVGLFATLWGGYVGSVHLTELSKDLGAPFHFLKRIELVLLFLIVCDTLKSPADVQRMTYVLMVSMVGLSAFAIHQYLSNPTVVTPGGQAEHIAVGPADPGHEAGLASMINVALALGLLPAVKRPAKLLLLAIVLFAAAVLPPTLGRSYTATTAIIMLYIGVTYQRWILLFFPVAWLVALYVYPPAIVQHILTLQHAFALDISGEATSGAAVISRAIPPAYFSLLGLGHSPILGFGLASRPLGFLDSEYSTQLFYTGLVGLAIFVMLWVRLFRLANEVVRTAREPLHAAMARGFHLVWVAYLVHSIFSASISASRAGALFFVAAGLLVALHRVSAQPREELRGVGTV